MARRKTTDPKLVALLDQREQARGSYERWWSRLRRAVNKLEAERRRVRRLTKRIDECERPKPAPEEKPDV